MSEEKGALTLGDCLRKHLPQSLEEALLVFILLALCLQGLDIIPVGGAAIKLFHVVALAELVIVVFLGLRHREALSWPPKCLSLTIACFALISVLNMPKNGFDTITLNYVFLYFVAALCLNLGKKARLERIRGLVQDVAVVVLGIVCVNALVNIEPISQYLIYQWDGHPDYPTVFNGGVNIEVSWLAMFGVFFRNDWKGRAYLGCVLALSLVFSSRSGLVLVALSALYVFVANAGLTSRRLARTLACLACCALAALLLAIVCGMPVVDRLLSIGGDGGSLGRMSIWGYSLGAFQRAPLLGYGGGNAMNAVRELSGYVFNENNVHNIYLQILVDYGIVGMAFFATTVVLFMRSVVRERLSNPFSAFLVLYLVIGLIQFRGGDPLVGFMAGCWVASASPGVLRPAVGHPTAR